MLLIHIFKTIIHMLVKTYICQYWFLIKIVHFKEELNWIYLVSSILTCSVQKGRIFSFTTTLVSILKSACIVAALMCVNWCSVHISSIPFTLIVNAKKRKLFLFYRCTRKQPINLIKRKIDTCIHNITVQGSDPDYSPDRRGP
jgi:hypothetical protein